MNKFEKKRLTQRQRKHDVDRLILSSNNLCIPWHFLPYLKNFFRPSRNISQVTLFRATYPQVSFHLPNLIISDDLSLVIDSKFLNFTSHFAFVSLLLP